MATITHKGIIKTLLLGKGECLDDPKVVSMYEYTAPINGERCVAIYYERMSMDPRLNPVALLLDGELTDFGNAMLIDLENVDVIEEGQEAST